MKNLLLFTFFLLIFSCKKEYITENKTNIEDFLVEKMIYSNGRIQEFIYDSLNRIQAIKYSNSQNSSSSIIEYKYNGNTVLISESIKRLCYLNNKGLMDSSIITIKANNKEWFDFESIVVHYFYNSNNMLTSNKAFNDHIYDWVSVRFNYYNIVYEVQNNNVIRKKFNSLINKDEINNNYTFYEDKKNDLAENTKLQSFVNGSQNLLKSETEDNVNFINYFYEFDTNGKLSKIIKDDGKDKSAITIIWRKK